MFKLLLLEDNPADAELMARELTKEQFASVRIVATRQEFEELAGRATEHFDAILADYKLGDWDGMAALEIAQANCPNTPFIFLSGSMSDEDAAETIKRGAADYVLKDRPARLKSAIEGGVEKMRLKLQARGAERMEHVGALSAGVAHDLNNLLTPVIVAAARFRDLAQTADDRKLVQIAQLSLKQASDLTRQMMILARGFNGTRKGIELPALLRQLVEFLRLTFHGIEVRERFPEWLPAVPANATQIHQVLYNLCINARDAMMPKGGTLCVGAEAVYLNQAQPFTASSPVSGKFVAVTIQDEGCGMSAETAARIFEPFFTTKGSKGTGFGLSNALRIATTHGGYIDLLTLDGRGSTFTLLLPVLQDAKAPNTPRTGGGRTILLVDDEQFLLEVAEAVLVGADYRVLRAGSGAEALSLYRENLSSIAAVLADLRMPGIDGASMLTQMRRLSPEMKVVLMTGAPDEAIGLPANAVLPKPYTPEQLLGVVDNLFAE